MRNNTGACLVGLCLLACVIGCSRFGQLSGSKVDLFAADNAAKGAAAIKAKVDGPANVIRVEMHSDKLEIEIQSPKNPKDIDKYTYSNGTVTSEPVQVMQIGNLSMTGDKYGTTPIDDIGWGNVAATVNRAIDLSKLENADVDVLSMEMAYADHTNPQAPIDRQKAKDELSKQIDDKRHACNKDPATLGKCFEELKPMEKQLHDMTFGEALASPLVFTWRIFVEGPRGRKDFWADKSGKLNEQAF